MCNDYEQHILWAEYCRMLESLALEIPTHQTELDLPQADDIHINDPAPIMRAAGGTRRCRAGFDDVRISAGRTKRRTSVQLPL